VLHQARESTYTPKNIKSAFEATGITPLNAWCTKEMKTYREKLRSETRALDSQLDPSVRRRNTQARYLDLANNPAATAFELQEALTEAVSMLEGAEARVALLGLELASSKEAVRERRKRVVQGGRVGKA
jgi:hypothetical protein